MTITQVNIQDLARQLRAKRANRALREVAEETGVSFSTLSRIEKGKVPDLDTFTKLCAWLKVSPETFTGFGSASKSHEEEIYAHLRAESALPQDVMESLVVVIRTAYANMGLRNNGKSQDESPSKGI